MQKMHANFDIPEDVMEKVAAAAARKLNDERRTQYFPPSLNILPSPSYA